VLQDAQLLLAQIWPPEQSAATWQLPGVQAFDKHTCPVPQLASVAHGPQLLPAQICPLLQSLLV
jgi:hypothetical protein